MITFTQRFYMINLGSCSEQQYDQLAALHDACNDLRDYTGAHAAVDEMETYPKDWMETLQAWIDGQYETSDPYDLFAEEMSKDNTLEAIEAMLLDMAPNY
jgi:hypothetical protein